MVKQPKTVTPTDGKVAMPASGQALVSQERGRCNMAFLRSHQAKPLANREPTRSRGPQNSRQEDLNWDRLCASTARTPACWGHAFGGSMSQAAVPQRAWPAPAHQGALAQGLSSLYWPGSREQRQKQTPARHHQRRAGSFFPVLPSAWHLMDLKNPRGKSHSMGRGMARNLPPDLAQGPIGVWLHRMGSEGARGQALGWPLGTSRCRGWRPCLRPPASAALLLCCHSNALGPPLQHRAAQGWHRETGGTPQPAAPPHTAPGLQGNTPWLSPPPLPTAAAAPRLPLPRSREKGGAHTSASAAPNPPSKQNRGGFSMWRGP